MLFLFLEQYFRRLEGPLALQVWSRFLQLVKDIIGGTKDFKTQHFSALRCATHLARMDYFTFILSPRCLAVLAEKITQTTAMEDRRIRKDVQVIFNWSVVQVKINLILGKFRKTFGFVCAIRRPLV